MLIYIDIYSLYIDYYFDNSVMNLLKITSQLSGEFRHSIKQFCFATSTISFICVILIILNDFKRDSIVAILSGAYDNIIY